MSDSPGKNPNQCNEEFRILFENSPDAIALTTPEGIIIDKNRVAYELFNFTDDSKYNDFPAIRLVSEKDRKRARGLVRSAIQKGYVKNKTLKLVKLDNTGFMAEVSVSVIKNKNSEPDRLIIIIKDITERLLYEKMLEETRDRAIESDNLKSAFLANMSHDIRTSMNAIIGFSKLLTTHHESDTDNKEYIEIIQSTGNTLLTLIDDIIDFAKIEAAEVRIVKSACNVHKVMKELHTSFEKECSGNPENDIDLILNLPHTSGDLVLLTDQDRLKQIFSNLLSNAIKFTEKGKVEFGYNIDLSGLEFYVLDTGIGIPEDKQNIIFERFRQLDFNYNTKYKGTGLGLSITKNLVKLLDGDITVESKKGEGSVFRFSLPLRRAEDQDRETKPNFAEMSNYNWINKVILIVEDNELNLKLLQKMIEPTGARVLFAKDGKPAIETCIANPDIDIVLMDIQMPEMDGYEATRAIKDIRPEMPVIAQTAYAMAHEKENIIEAGCNDYLSKPIRQKELLDVLNKYLKL